MTGKKYWITVTAFIIAGILLFTSGFLLSKHLLIQKTRLIVSECSQELKKAVDMNKTWCAPNNIRIGQCEDDIYVCLCSSPGDLGISE